ncbi:MAG: cupin domain-containing protein [Thaumarchaeota archaeon]|nr:cupin domain-containing protein [Nitrososphaerota archaeon]
MSNNLAAERKNFSERENETRVSKNGKIELVQINGSDICRTTFKPGWKWSNDMKPSVKTDLCEAPHFFYVISGKIHVKTDDGKEFDVRPGDVSFISKSHDAWVVGNEPAVTVDWFGATEQAKKS